MDYKEKNDNILGSQVKKHLEKLGLESPYIETGLDPDEKIRQIENNLQHVVFSVLGLDPKNDSVSDTPKRIARMYVKEVMYGLDYNNFPRSMSFENALSKNPDDNSMVVVKNITVNSMCSHHFVPVIGHAAVGYIPKDKIIGLSKLNRVVDFFARRPQEQERQVAQTQAALEFILDTEDVAVSIVADHFCVKWRGVHQDSNMITAKLGGRFMSDPTVRKEFYDIINK